MECPRQESSSTRHAEIWITCRIIFTLVENLLSLYLSPIKFHDVGPSSTYLEKNQPGIRKEQIMIAFFVCSAETLLLRYEHLFYSILSTHKKRRNVDDDTRVSANVASTSNLYRCSWMAHYSATMLLPHTIHLMSTFECAKGEEEFLLHWEMGNFSVQMLIGSS